MRVLLLILLLASAEPSWGQTVGTCNPAQAEAYLDVGNVRARLFNNGAFFFRGNPSSYEIPKGSGKHVLFSSEIWLAGMTGDTLRTAGSTYGPYEFWPGPLGDAGDAPADCSRFDRIWSVSRQDMELFRRRGQISMDLKEWPTGLGAPTLDARGRRVDVSDRPLSERANRLIRLEEGEVPDLMGDQMLWWVMNDLGNEHVRYIVDWQAGIPGNPIGVEIRATAFAFDVPGVLGNSTFYRLELIKPVGPPLSSTFIGIRQDPDLGGFDDDYVGSDTTLGLAYTYNSDNLDGIYGEAPPAVGLDFLRGPSDGTGKRLGMRSMMFYFGGAGVLGEGPNNTDMYNLLQGIWRDGTPQTWGGDGYRFSSIPSPMGYTGTPPEAWSEFDLGDGTAHAPSDRRYIAATGPFTLSPDQPQELFFGIVTSFGADHLDSVRQLKEDAAFVQDLADQGWLESRLPMPESAPPEFDLAASVYPVPAQDRLTLRYSLPQTMFVSIRIYDALGRQVASVIEGSTEAGSYQKQISVSNWPPGLYMVRVQMDTLIESRTVIVGR